MLHIDATSGGPTQRRELRSRQSTIFYASKLRAVRAIIFDREPLSVLARAVTDADPPLREKQALLKLIAVPGSCPPTPRSRGRGAYNCNFAAVAANCFVAENRGVDSAPSDRAPSALKPIRRPPASCRTPTNAPF
jgi:hypothetical protein